MYKILLIRSISFIALARRLHPKDHIITVARRTMQPESQDAEAVLAAASNPITGFVGIINIRRPGKDDEICEEGPVCKTTGEALTSLVEVLEKKIANPRQRESVWRQMRDKRVGKK